MHAMRPTTGLASAGRGPRIKFYNPMQKIGWSRAVAASLVKAAHLSALELSLTRPPIMSGPTPAAVKLVCKKNGWAENQDENDKWNMAWVGVPKPEFWKKLKPNQVKYPLSKVAMRW